MLKDRPVVSVVRAWSGALTRTTGRLAGHIEVLGQAVAFGQQAAA